MTTSSFPIDEVSAALAQARQQWRQAHQRTQEPGGREFPSRDALAQVVAQLKGVLFPMRLGPHDLLQESENYYVAHTLDAALHGLQAQIALELRYGRRDLAEAASQAHGLTHQFALALPGIRHLLDTDVQAAYEGDPAARTVDEVLLCYPGVLALIHHRLAHQLYEQGLPLLARIVAELAHSETGIDIHPGAQIGAGFFIDHGTGVVIGETAVIGRRVRIYQAVTLGAKRFEQDAQGHLQKGLPRHPVVEDGVVIYAGATILGRVTLGAGAVIGGNVWLTQDVPPGASVTQASLQAQAVSQAERRVRLAAEAAL
ncbi:serine O-acetyltransferase EpsC [Comamonas odontotermitis]|uniref:serine O-acetyltransferase EpsC n=1 Tax=Comamonas odontotermitis TaxID=379895 RepID=UPI001CC5B52D|nr:serine O-acetyltransferase EpsC [Comamonas odontotermitis]UBB16778.1 serine acetyltransferase [Comamonas odontotermitis]